MPVCAKTDPTEVKRRLLYAVVRFLTPGSWAGLTRARVAAGLTLAVLAGIGAHLEQVLQVLLDAG